LIKPSYSDQLIPIINDLISKKTIATKVLAFESLNLIVESGSTSPFASMTFFVPNFFLKKNLEKKKILFSLIVWNLTIKEISKQNQSPVVLAQLLRFYSSLLAEYPEIFQGFPSFLFYFLRCSFYP